MPSNATRRTIYWMHGQAVSLAYVPDIDGHPEVTNDNQSPPAPPPKTRRESGPRLTAHYIRKVLAKPEPPRPDQAQYDAVMRRIVREGA